MELAIEDGEITAVQHNSCKRGVEYARQEYYDPRRMITATATLTGGILKRVPVRTSAPIPIQHINDLLHAIYELTIVAPLPVGTAVIKNFAGTGIDVMTTRKVRQSSGRQIE
jgi:CxxC motif-containing protein